MSCEKYLVSSGFFIEKEALAEDGDKIYSDNISRYIAEKKKNLLATRNSTSEKETSKKENENPVIFSSFRKKLEGTLQKKTAAETVTRSVFFCQIKSLLPERI